jgi:AmmeMemoRadiSam system protein A
LSLARAAIVDRVLSDGSLERCRAAVQLTPSLETNRGAFVTLHVLDPPGSPTPRRLRGCIGTIAPQEALHENVVRNAVHAAFDDPRFPALDREECCRLHIEISVLTPLEPAGDPESIVPGRDGVVLTHPSGSAVFLPQVATEQGWSLHDLLENLALKAGLSRDAWKEGRVEIFRVELFGED